MLLLLTEFKNENAIKDAQRINVLQRYLAALIQNYLKVIAVQQFQIVLGK